MFRKGLFLLLCVSCVAVLPLTAQPLSEHSQRKETFEIIPSPLFRQVVFIPVPGADFLNLDLIFPYGEIDNPFEQGMMHYAEHLAWHNAFFPEAAIGQSLEVRESAKGSNAFTGKHATAYVAGSNSSSFRDDLLALLHVSAPIDLDDEFALTEREIVLREFARRGKSALGEIFDDIDASLYGDAPYSRSVIGKPEGIAAFDLARTKLLHQRSHRLEDATLVVFGGLPRIRLMAVIEEFRPRSNPNSVEPLTEVIDVSGPGSGLDSQRIETDATQTDMFEYRKLLPVPDCAPAAHCIVLLAVLNDALSGTSDGGLSAVLVFDEFAATNAFMNLGVFPNNLGQVSISVTGDVGVTASELESLVFENWDRMLKDGVTQDAFDRAVARLALEQRETIKWKEEQDATYSLIINSVFEGQEIYGFWDQVDALEELTIENVNDFLRAWNGEGRTVIRYIVPKSN